MTFRCPLCENTIETAVDLVDGQHVICPCCNRKFSYFQQKTSGSLGCQTFSRVVIPVKKQGGISFHRFWKILKSSFRVEDCLSRTDYCLVVIPTLSIACVLSRAMSMTSIVTPIAYSLVEGSALFILLSAAIRRLADANKSRYWVLLFLGLAILFKLDVFYNIIFLALCALRSNGGGKRCSPDIPAMWVKIAFVILVLFYPLAYNYHIRRLVSNMETKVLKMKAEALKNTPFRNIGWSLIQGGDGMSSVYMFTTDAPARAKCVAVYVMGSLTNLEMTQIEDESKREAVENYIRRNFELEGALHRRR